MANGLETAVRLAEEDQGKAYAYASGDVVVYDGRPYAPAGPPLRVGTARGSGGSTPCPVHAIPYADAAGHRATVTDYGNGFARFTCVDEGR